MNTPPTTLDLQTDTAVQYLASTSMLAPFNIPQSTAAEEMSLQALGDEDSRCRFRFIIFLTPEVAPQPMDFIHSLPQQA